MTCSASAAGGRSSNARVAERTRRPRGCHGRSGGRVGRGPLRPREHQRRCGSSSMNRSQRLRLVGRECELVFRMRAACNTTMAGAGTQSMSSRHAASNTANSSSSLLMPSLSSRYRQVSHLPDLALRAPPPTTVVPDLWVGWALTCLTGSHLMAMFGLSYWAPMRFRVSRASWRLSQGQAFHDRQTMPSR